MSVSIKNNQAVFMADKLDSKGNEQSVTLDLVQPVSIDVAVSTLLGLDKAVKNASADSVSLLCSIWRDFVIDTVKINADGTKTTVKHPLALLKGTGKAKEQTSKVLSKEFTEQARAFIKPRFLAQLGDDENALTKWQDFCDNTINTGTFANVKSVFLEYVYKIGDLPYATDDGLMFSHGAMIRILKDFRGKDSEMTTLSERLAKIQLELKQAITDAKFAKIGAVDVALASTYEIVDMLEPLYEEHKASLARIETLKAQGLDETAAAALDKANVAPLATA